MIIYLISKVEEIANKKTWKILIMLIQTFYISKFYKNILKVLYKIF